ncbi:MAG: site-specific integrase, partial [Methylovirgula sp.]
MRDPDGLTVFSFAHAQERARAFFNEKARALAGMAAPSNGPYTVNRALDEYFAERERRGSKSARIDRYSANARIRTTIGDVEVRKLTTPRIRQWQAELEKAPKLRRTAKGAAKRKTAAVNPKDPDAVRARKASANRVLTILKA